jgi:spore coat protein H
MKRLSVLVVLLFGAAVVILDGQAVRPLLLGIGQPPPAASSSPEAFFDDTVLHEIRLDMNTRDWQTLKDNFRLNDYYPADLRWRDQTVRGIGIRSRGSGSRSGVKPGLRVDIDHYTASQRFLGLKSFVLRNNTQDASNMRERISMLLFRRLGLLASREAHTKLFINSDYAGVYTIVESVDKDFLKRTLNENDGYLYEYHYPVEPYFFDDLGSDPAKYVPVPFKPETHESDPRPEFIVQLVQTLNQASDAAFRTAIAEYVDLRKFVRHVAVERFLADYDSILGDFGMNNFYFYRFVDKNLFTFIAWDKSQAFSDATHSIWRNVTEGPAHSNKLMTRALASRDLYDLYLDTLIECAASLDDAGATGQRWVDREIDREYGQIRDAVYADPQKDYSNEQFDGEVNRLREFALQRGPFVATEVNAARALGPPR